MATAIRDLVDEFIVGLDKAVQLSRNYGRDHRMTKEAIRELFDTLSTILVERDEIVIGIIGDELVFEKEPFFKTSENRKRFIQRLKDQKIERIRIFLGASHHELNEFVHMLAGHVPSEETFDDVQTYLAGRKVQHIQVGDIVLKATSKADDTEELRQLSLANFEDGIRFLKNTGEGFEQNRPLDMEGLRKTASGLVQSMLSNGNLLLLLASLRMEDLEKLVHNVNVCVFTLMQAEMIGLERRHLVSIAEAALLHNIGEMFSVGAKGGKSGATVDDKKEIRSFWARQGAKTLLHTEQIHFLSSLVAFEQFIRYDGLGEPERIVGDRLNLVSMMVSIANYYDNRRRNPFYDEDCRPEVVYEEMMKLSGLEFNPDLLRNFFAGLGVYPPGTLVELDSHEVGLVIQRSILDMSRPTVEILYGRNGELYDHPNIVNLLERDDRGKYRWSIIRSIYPIKQYGLPAPYASMAFYS